MAGNLLPFIKNSFFSPNHAPKNECSASLVSDAFFSKLEKENGAGDYIDRMKSLKDDDKANDTENEEGLDPENLRSGSFEVLQLEKEEILAPHTHFCAVCGKGFKRDANLRMHMRGHGDEYKTVAALAKPGKQPESALIKRYSCPFSGCKRNKEHKGFQPLKSLLCVKNHYKRCHCDKSYMCGRCNAKKFSVLADLKTHEKHCGRDKWLCSCGTTFSRKDKLFGHVALFQGHAPMLPADSRYGSGSPSRSNGNGCGLSTCPLYDATDAESFDDDRCYLSSLSFDPYEYGVSNEFMKEAFGLAENF